MDRWIGSVAVVTGASAGIGASIAVELVKAGLTVVGLARRPERVEELRSQLPADRQSALHSFRCDVSKEADILSAFAWVESTLGPVAILINNAGTCADGNLLDADNSDWLRRILDTNVLGLVQCTREAFKSMRKHQIDGHVVLINSIAGHNVPALPGVGSMNLLAPSKYAVTAITEVLRQEFNALASRTKVTSVSPGFVMTEMALLPDELKKADFAKLVPADVAAAVLYAIGTPPHVQVHELTIKPVGEAF